MVFCTVRIVITTTTNNKAFQAEVKERKVNIADASKREGALKMSLYKHKYPLF